MKTNKRRLSINSNGKIEGFDGPNSREKLTSKTRTKRKPKAIYITRNIERARKRAVNRVLRSMAEFLNQLYKKPTRKYFGLNKVFKDNVQSAVTGEHPRFQVDYTKIIFSHGDLPLPPNLSVSSPYDGELVIRWTDDSGIGKARADDHLYAVVISHVTKDWITEVFQVPRKVCGCCMNVEMLRCEPVHVYLGFLSEDRCERSNSYYAGIVNIL